MSVVFEPDQIGASEKLAKLAVILGQRPIDGLQYAPVQIRIAGSRYDLGALLAACCERIDKLPRL